MQHWNLVTWSITSTAETLKGTPCKAINLKRTGRTSVPIRFMYHLFRIVSITRLQPSDKCNYQLLKYFLKRCISPYLFDPNNSIQFNSQLLTC